MLNYGISDHLPIFMVKRRQSWNKEFEYLYKRSFRNYDKETLYNKLHELDWTILDLLEDVNLAWSMIYKGILNIVNDHCPYK